MNITIILVINDCYPDAQTIAIWRGWSYCGDRTELHVRMVRRITFFGYRLINVLNRILHITGLAVQAVLRVNLELNRIFSSPFLFSSFSYTPAGKK